MSAKLFSIETILKQFEKWLTDAKNHPSIKEYNAVNLATATKDGKPSNRNVLLKQYDEAGFVFYTNLNSQKSKEIIENPYVSMCFFWDALSRQIRITGEVSKIADERADEYFNSRDYRSKIGAHISRQSEEVESYQKLKLLFAKEVTQASMQSEIKRPSNWSGYCLNPNYFEFWQAGNFRIHKREVYKKQTGNQFSKHYLYP